MPIGWQTGRLGISVHKGPVSGIWVPEKTPSRQLMNRGNTPLSLLWALEALSHQRFSVFLESASSIEGYLACALTPNA